MNYFCHFIVFAYGEIKVIFMQPIFSWYPDESSVPFQGKLISVDLGVRFVLHAVAGVPRNLQWLWTAGHSLQSPTLGGELVTLSHAPE